MPSSAFDRIALGRHMPQRPHQRCPIFFEQIGAEPSLDNRREMAVQLAPLLHEYQTTYLEIGRSLRIADDDVLVARAGLIWSEMMDEVSEAAEWPRYGDGADFFIRMIEAMPHADDDEAAR
jgi:hypothetical protein